MSVTSTKKCNSPPISHAPLKFEVIYSRQLPTNSHIFGRWEGTGALGETHIVTDSMFKITGDQLDGIRVAGAVKQ